MDNNNDYNTPNNSWDTFRSYQNNLTQQDNPNEYRYSYQSVNDQVGAQKPAPKKKGGFLRTTALVIAFALLAAVCGAGGSLLANRYLTAGAPASAGQTVIKESVGNSGSPVSTGTGSLTIAELAAATQNSVVEITTESVQYGTWMGQYVSEGAGSGVIVSADGYILTCNHVISGASKVTVKTADGTAYNATVVGADSATDLAVLKIDATGLSAATFGSSAALQVGDFVLAIGNPLGELGGTVTDGIISALSRDVTINNETMTLLQTNAAVNPGNSGGGLFDGNGNLIGIVNAKSSGDSIEGIGFAIPADLAKEIMTDLIEQGYVGGRFKLGVNILEITDERTASMYRVDRLGVYIQAVENGGNAQRGGLQAGDCILTFDGKTIDAYSDLTDALAECEAEQQVEVTVLRAGKEYSMIVQLYESKS